MPAPLWKPGQSGNPSGRQKLPDHVARLKDHSKLHVIEAMAKTMLMTREQLKAHTARPDATMAELLVGSLMIKAIETADPIRTQCLLNYVVGRPTPYEPADAQTIEAEAAQAVLRSVPSSAIIEALRAQQSGDRPHIVVEPA